MLTNSFGSKENMQQRRTTKAISITAIAALIVLGCASTPPAEPPPALEEREFVENVEVVVLDYALVIMGIKKLINVIGVVSAMPAKVGALIAETAINVKVAESKKL